MATTFDGDTLTITLSTVVNGVLTVDVQDDLYEPWKEWVKAGNSKYPPAFRSDGGSPLSAIINQGSYFFLNNVVGWRLKPAENDGTYFIVGNLAAEDTSLETFIPTTGTFTTAIIGLQPVTQGVTPVMGEQLAYGSFSEGVWVDVVYGVAGTGLNSAGRPIGTPQDPSNNVQDAVVIQAAQGLPKTIYVIGDLTLDTGDDISGFKIIGQNPVRSTITVNTAAVTNNSAISECTLTGVLDGGSLVEDCTISTLTYFNGLIKRCQLDATITLGGGAQADIRDSVSGIAGQTTPIIDMGGSGQSLTLRRYVGGVKIINKTGADAASVDLASGQVQVDLTTVTNGLLVVRGTGKCVNAADTNDHLISGTYGSLTLNNETASGLMIQDLWQLQGLDPDNPMTVTPTTRTAGGVNINITGDGVTTSTVTRT